MNDEQYKRYRRMTSEAINCLYRTHDKNKRLHFLISGSKGANYKVTIPPDGKMTCTCPDFVNNASVQECICKHCLFVIYQDLRYFKDVDHLFFKRRFFTPDEVRDIHNIYREKKVK